MNKLGINFDEISDDIQVSLGLMKDCGVKYGELRTLHGKNFVFWNDEEVMELKNIIDSSNVEVIAAATPLFKWYGQSTDPEVPHDSFGFNPRLSYQEKVEVIKRTFVIAKHLNISRLRIFSELGTKDNAGALFSKNRLLHLALDLAEKNNIDLYLENEPVCTVHTKQETANLLEAQKHPRLKLWLDIANMIEVGQQIDADFISKVATRLGYVHLKDFTLLGQKRYVPLGKGVIDYPSIINIIDAQVSNGLIYTVETHAAPSSRYESSRQSLLAAKKLLKL